MFFKILMIVSFSFVNKVPVGIPYKKISEDSIMNKFKVFDDKQKIIPNKM